MPTSTRRQKIVPPLLLSPPLAHLPPPPLIVRETQRNLGSVVFRVQLHSTEQRLEGWAWSPEAIGVYPAHAAQTLSDQVWNQFQPALGTRKQRCPRALKCSRNLMCWLKAGWLKGNNCQRPVLNSQPHGPCGFRGLVGGQHGLNPVKPHFFTSLLTGYPPHPGSTHTGCYSVNARSSPLQLPLGILPKMTEEGNSQKLSFKVKLWPFSNLFSRKRFWIWILYHWLWNLKVPADP